MITKPTIIIDNNLIFNNQLLHNYLDKEETINLLELNKHNIYRITDTYNDNYINIINDNITDIDDIYKPYIDIFHAFLTISTGQHIKGTVCSYEGTLIFTFSYNLVDPSIQRCFFRRLASDGLHVEIESNGVHYV